MAYADCGTRGALDAVLAEANVERIVGAHCYEFYAGASTFAALQEEDPGTFYLTDFLARQFDTMIIRGLGLDEHPELLPMYFGNYHRLIYLAQTDDPALLKIARRAAKRLGLTFEHRQTGFGELGPRSRPWQRSRALPHLSGTLMGVLTVIWWRDIPAQVVAKDGRRASKIVLHPRFQVAIDRAAIKAGRRSMDDYIAEWHKVQRPCGDDLEAEATAEVARLEATYTRRVLDHLVTTGGAEVKRTEAAPNPPPTPPSRPPRSPGDPDRRRLDDARGRDRAGPAVRDHRRTHQPHRPEGAGRRDEGGRLQPRRA